MLSKEDLRQLALKMEKPRVPGVERLLEMSLQCRDRRGERHGEAQPGLDAPLSVLLLFSSIVSASPLTQNPGSSSFPENSGVALVISATHYLRMFPKSTTVWEERGRLSFNPKTPT